jgi:AcrR family transcriptional regulator
MPRSRDDATAVATRQRLIEAAVEVFSAEGYAATRVADVARRSNVTTGAIYSHFRNKAELLLAGIRRGTSQIMGEVTERAEAGITPAAQFETMGRRLSANHGEPLRQLLLEAFTASKRDPEVARHLQQVIASEAEGLRRLARAGKRTGDIDPDADVEAIVRIAQAVSFGFMFLDAIGETPIEDHAWSDVIHRLVAGWAPAGDEHQQAEPVPSKRNRQEP